MQVLFLIIKKVELVDDIMKALANANISGATVMDSEGMAKSISGMDNLPTIKFLKDILNGESSANKGKTLFVVVHDEQIEDAKQAIMSVTGDLSQPNTGVMFGVPVSFALGFK